MGRRIPKSKRHKKLKCVDRKDSVKDSRSNRPPHTLEQEVPRSLQALFGEQRRPKKKRRSKQLIKVRPCKGEGEQRGMTRPLKGLPETLTQERYETDDQFLGRIGRHAGKALGEARVEEKFDVQILEDEAGRVTVDARGSDPSYGARKREKRRAREKRLREKKRRKRSDTEGDFSLLLDRVPFGEVADRPPDVAPREGEPKKAGARNLLLRGLLPQEGTDRTGPRKKLSAREREKLETERRRAVALYRRTKATLKRT